jgi:hypothetical protein
MRRNRLADFEWRAVALAGERGHHCPRRRWANDRQLARLRALACREHKKLWRRPLYGP